MFRWTQILENFAPDIAVTVRRFPLPVIFTAFAALVSVLLINEIVPDQSEFWLKLGVGSATAALFATAGRLFSESRPGKPLLSVLVEVIIPTAVIAVMQLNASQFIVPSTLPLIAIFWLSISAFTEIGRGEERAENQNRFWWINHRAMASAIIAGAGFGVIALGLIAIERTITVLFGLDIGHVFYQYLLPVAGLFLAPIYWLSCIPKLNEYSADEMENPDFLSKAIGFLGQFLFVPLLLAYAAILLVYTSQIVFTFTLPNGTLSWMVLGFTTIGAATWLILHPVFMRERQMVRLFRLAWVWLTLLPLALFALAVWVRIDTYGLTTQRIILVAGGVWAAGISTVYLTRSLSDIRLIPALAGAVLLLAAVGPWNFVNGPIWNQSVRLEAALDSVGWNATQNKPDWTTKAAADARAAVNYLLYQDDTDALGKILTGRGAVYDQSNADRNSISALLNLPDEYDSERSKYFSISTTFEMASINLSATPFFLGELNYSHGKQPLGAEYQASIEENALLIFENDVEINRIEFNAWLSRQQKTSITDPVITFEISGRTYALVVSKASGEQDQAQSDIKIEYITALLFASK